jgi:SAM-dependent methyltransferase
MSDYDPIAAFYDLEHESFREDTDLYLNLVQEGPVLEVGAGTGRIVRQLAGSGLEVWGVDSSAGMLARARTKLHALGNVHLVEGEITQISLGRQFAAAILGLNTLWHATTLEAQLDVLRAVHAHLRPAGVLILDMSNPLTMADRDAQGELRQVFRAPYLGGSVSRLTAAWDEPGEQILRLAVAYDTTSADGRVSRCETTLTLRYLYRFEAELLLRLGGFDVRNVYGSYDLAPFDAHSPRILIVARRSR